MSLFDVARDQEHVSLYSYEQIIGVRDLDVLDGEVSEYKGRCNVTTHSFLSGYGVNERGARH